MSENRHLAQLNIGRFRYPRFYSRRPEWFEKIKSPHYAFGWESVPAAQLWQTARCAPDEQAA